MKTTRPEDEAKRMGSLHYLTSMKVSEMMIKKTQYNILAGVLRGAWSLELSFKGALDFRGHQEFIEPSFSYPEPIVKQKTDP